MQKTMLSITTQLFQSECGRQHFLGGTAVVERGRVLATDEQHVTKAAFVTSRTASLSQRGRGWEAC